MSAPFDIDVLVVGLGPAGAAAAAEAARGGARVLAVERNARPGLPVQCAEFVPMMIRADAPEVTRARVQDIDMMATFIGAAPAEITPEFRGHMIDRAAFDQALITEAIAAGARCLFATPLRGLSSEGLATLTREALRARVIIGADGPLSAVGRALGCPNTDLVETRQITCDLMVAQSTTDIFLRPDYVGGYGWLFPKGTDCNLGLGVVPEHRFRLKPLLEALQAELVAAGRVGAGVRRLTGGVIPVGGIVGLQGRLGDVAVLLAGDAAGLTNPVTGAGIASAVASGRLAGQVAAAICDGDAGAATDYAEEITATYGAALALAVRRRRGVLAAYAGGGCPGPEVLRDGWIASPRYWAKDSAAAGAGETT